MQKYARIIDNETKKCEVGLGNDVCFYQGLGMELLDVEEAYNHNWYLCGYVPSQPLPTKEEIQQQRAKLMSREADPLKYDYEEAVARGADNAETLKQIWLAKKDEIRNLYPYPENN